MTEIAIPLRWTLGGVFGTLAAASAITGALARYRPAWNLVEVSARVRTWWVMTVAFSAALIVGPTMSIVFFALVSLLAMREFLRMTRIEDRIVTGIAFSAVPSSYALLAFGSVSAAWLTPIAISALASPALAAVTSRNANRVESAAATGQAVMLAVWAPMHAVLLLIHPAATGPAGGAGLLVFLVLCTEIGDVAQFLSGKAIGKTPIAPLVSPNKTVAGVIGGAAVTATIALLVGPLLTDFTMATAAAVGGAIALLGFCGDLMLSALKRQAGIKDTGTLLPGHGGVLDRIDSLILTAPAFAALVVLA